MTTLVEKKRPDPVRNQVRPVAGTEFNWSGTIVGLHAVLAACGMLFDYGFFCVAQAAILGFWVVIGRGSIWGRLLLALAASLLLMVAAGMTAPQVMRALLLSTLFFSTTFTELLVLLIAQWKEQARLRIRFQSWEVFAGMAFMAGGLALVSSQFHVAGTPPGWQSSVMYVLLTAATHGALIVTVGLPYLLVTGDVREMTVCAVVIGMIVLPLMGAAVVAEFAQQPEMSVRMFIICQVNTGVIALTLYHWDKWKKSKGSALIETSPPLEAASFPAMPENDAWLDPLLQTDDD